MSGLENLTRVDPPSQSPPGPSSLLLSGACSFWAGDPYLCHWKIFNTKNINIRPPLCLGGCRVFEHEKRFTWMQNSTGRAPLASWVQGYSRYPEEFDKIPFHWKRKCETGSGWVQGASKCIWQISKQYLRKEKKHIWWFGDEKVWNSRHVLCATKAS